MSNIAVLESFFVGDNSSPEPADFHFKMPRAVAKLGRIATGFCAATVLAISLSQTAQYFNRAMQTTASVVTEFGKSLQPYDAQAHPKATTDTKLAGFVVPAPEHTDSGLPNGLETGVLCAAGVALVDSVGRRSRGVAAPAFYDGEAPSVSGISYDLAHIPTAFRLGEGSSATYDTRYAPGQNV